MRTKNSILNIFATMLLFGIKVAFNFIGKTVLIFYLGDNYNGLSSFFTNIISMLSIAELGIGSAIIYNLYKPINENDVNTIKTIMNFYKRCYYAIAIIVLIIGLGLLKFIPILIGEIDISDNIYFLYLLFLLDSFFSYILSYKRSILYADQKNYIISYFDIGYYVFLNIGQILIIFLSRNYVLYLVYMIVCRLLENLIINQYVNKKYRYLTEKVEEDLDVNIKNDIIKKVKGLLFHQIGNYIVLGTDNIIISKLLGIIYVGFYSNYSIVLSPISNIISQIMSSTTASVGNLLLEKNVDKNYSVYRKISLICFWLYSCSGICIFFLIQDFIKLWLGDRYLFSDFVVIILVLNFYFQGMRSGIGVFKTASGIYYEDRYVPLAESLINIIVSLILVKRMGISGVFIGTIASSIPLFFYSFPFLVYEPIFKRNVRSYFFEQIKYLLIFLIILLLLSIFNFYFINNFNIDSDIIYFLVKTVCVVIISNTLLFIVFYKNNDLKDICSKIKNIVSIIKKTDI